MKLNNKDILSVLYKAKEQFITDKNLGNYLGGMCFYIRNSIYSIFNIRISYFEIKYIIPEFVPETFGLNEEYSSFWWNVYDVNSRINAFDKLIKIYKNKINEI